MHGNGMEIPINTTNQRVERTEMKSLLQPEGGRSHSTTPLILPTSIIKSKKKQNVRGRGNKERHKKLKSLPHMAGVGVALPGWGREGKNPWSLTCLGQAYIHGLESQETTPRKKEEREERERR